MSSIDQMGAEVQAQLNAYLRRTHETKVALARRLEVSRQALFGYLTQGVCPKWEVIARVLRLDGVEIRLGGKLLTADAPSPKRPMAVASQKSLPFAKPEVAESSNRAIRTEVRATPEGEIILSVRLKIS